MYQSLNYRCWYDNYSGVTFRMFKALAKKINIEVISTSEIKISVLINKKLKKSVEILHQEFKLSNSL